MIVDKKRGRAVLAAFMSFVLASTLMVPDLAFAQGTATAQSDSSSTATTSATTATSAKISSTATAEKAATTSTSSKTATGSAKTATTSAAAASADSATAATTSATADSAATDSAVAATTAGVSSASVASTYSTGLAYDPTAIAKQNAINESYNEAYGTSSKSATTQSTKSTSTLPTKYDLRTADTYDGTWTARNQAPWGCCWAFGNTASIESNILKQAKGAGASSLNLAERQLAWFAGVPVNAQTVIAGRAIDADQYGEGTTSNLDRGGNGSIAAEVLTTWQGLASESQGIPYLASDGTITKSNDLWSLAEAQRALASVHVINVDKLASPTTASNAQVKGNLTYYDNIYNPAGTAAIKEALMSTGGVSIAFHVDTISGLGNSSQYWNSKTGAQYISTLITAGAGATDAEKALATADNHGVCIVGWDDTYSADNFSTKPKGNGAFLCRNSWGSYGSYVNSTIGGQSVPLETGTTSSGQDMGQVFYQNGQIYVIRNGQVVGLGADKVTLTKSTTDGLNVTEIYTDQSGNTYSIKKTITEDGKDAPTFDGYFWLSYYDATISDPTAYTAEAADSKGKYSTDHIYENDYLGLASLVATNEGAFDTKTTKTSGTSKASGAKSTTKTVVAQAANVFTAKANEALTAVSVATKTAANTVQILIYRLVKGAKSPTQSSNGQPEITTTVTVKNAGYHTIALSAPLYLKKGESFSVVERITNAKGQGYIPLEMATSGQLGGDGGYITYSAKAGAGESYISQDGGKTWTDVSTLSLAYFKDKYDAKEYDAQGITLEGVGNVMIRAFTKDWTPTPTPTPTPSTPANAPTSTAAATTANGAVYTVSAGAETPQTGDSTLEAALLLMALMTAGAGAAVYARRRAEHLK